MLLLVLSELEPGQGEWRSFQIEKFNGVAPRPRPGGVAHLAKKFLPKRADVLRFGACLFLAGGPFTVRA
jgi:hypothetical protein